METPLGLLNKQSLFNNKHQLAIRLCYTDQPKEMHVHTSSPQLEDTCRKIT